MSASKTQGGKVQMKDLTMGGFIAAKRQEKGLTQLELGERMGVTDKAVSKWEREDSHS